MDNCDEMSCKNTADVLGLTLEDARNILIRTKCSVKSLARQTGIIVGEIDKALEKLESKGN